MRFVWIWKTTQLLASITALWVTLDIEKFCGHPANSENISQCEFINHVSELDDESQIECQLTGCIEKSSTHKMSDRSCYNCGKQGHLSRDCTDSRRGGGGGGGGGRECYNCGKDGHISRDCPDRGGGSRGGGSNSCYNCGEPGHMSRDCNKRSGGGGGGGSCYRCGKPGHISRDCRD